MNIPDSPMDGTAPDKNRASRLVFITPVLFILLIVAFELVRLSFAWLVIEKSTRYGARFAITESYDTLHCADLDNDSTPCAGASSQKEIDAARVLSIKDITRQVLQGIHYDENLKDTQAGFLKITVCSNGADSIFTPPQSKKPVYAKCLPDENAGLPGERASVSVDYNFKFMFFPVFGIGPRFIHLASHREGINEYFRDSRAANTPPLNSPSLTPDASTPVPNENSTARQLQQVDEILSQSLNGNYSNRDHYPGLLALDG